MSSGAQACTLERWLGPLRRAEFEQQILDQRAWAWPRVAKDEAEHFGWCELDALLQSQPSPDVLVVAHSQLLEDPEPRSLSSLREQMARGAGICVRRAERHHEALAKAANALGRSFDTSVHVQVFVTPAQTHGFGWHYDAEHVFIIQTVGTKDYYFRENTCGRSDERPDFSLVRRERSPLQTARLLPGDCLYLPAGFWHMARSLEDSLSISLGVRLAQTAWPKSAAQAR
jgi:50S ribosomal protein L16 3-hydroxylase